MVNFPQFRSCAIAVILLAIAGSEAFALSKEEVGIENRKCENRWARCETRCDGKRLWREQRDCRDGCLARLNACYRRVDQLGHLKPEAGESGSGAPVLSTKP